MKRFIVASITAGVVFGSVWALAANLNVGSATAATGQGEVVSCGDVTGSTFILLGRSVLNAGQNASNPSVETGIATDITKTTGVNVEVPESCIVQEGEGDALDTGATLDVQVKAGATIVGSGTCEVQSHAGLGTSAENGSDNVPGCTVTFAGPTDIAPIDALVVTET